MTAKKNKPKTDLEETPEFSQPELEQAILDVQASELNPSLKNLLIKCLKCVATINAILNRKKTNIRRLKRLFGIKTEKKSLLPQLTHPRRQKILKILARRATGKTLTKTTPEQKKS
jgi:hypothetical protein